MSETVVTEGSVMTMNGMIDMHTVRATMDRGFGMTTDIVMLTGEQAARYIQAWSYDGQRRLSRSHIESLTGAILREELTRLELHLAYLDGRELLVDGQHRLHAFVRVTAQERPDLTLPTLIVRHFCESEEDVARLFATYDRNKVRTFNDIFDAMGTGVAAGLTSDDRRYLSYAVPLLMSGFATSKSGSGQALWARSAQVRAQVIDNWALEGAAYFETIRGTTREIRGLMRRAAVVAVAVETLRYQEPRARVFWGRVAAGTGLEVGDPEHTLLTFLRNIPTTRYAPWLYARYVAGAWNAAYREERLARLSVRNADVPILILGTRFGQFNRRRDDEQGLGMRRPTARRTGVDTD